MDEEPPISAGGSNTDQGIISLKAGCWATLQHARAMSEEEEPVYEVERIVTTRKNKQGDRQFLIKWIGAHLTAAPLPLAFPTGACVHPRAGGEGAHTAHHPFARCRWQGGPTTT